VADAALMLNVIATDGAAVQMVDGNGYGYNWDGPLRSCRAVLEYRARRARGVCRSGTAGQADHFLAVTHPEIPEVAAVFDIARRAHCYLGLRWRDGAEGAE
jgi:hypothetical protein